MYKKPQCFSDKPQVGENIVNNIDFLKKVIKTKSDKNRKRILKLATNRELLCLVEIALNIVKSQFRLKPYQKQKIVPHLTFLRKLANKRSEKGTRNFLIQKGEGIALSALVTPIILEVIKYFSNKK